MRYTIVVNIPSSATSLSARFTRWSTRFGALSTGRYYGATRQDLAPNTASAPAATIATAAANWAACAIAMTYQQQRNRGLRGSRSRPAVTTAARF